LLPDYAFGRLSAEEAAAVEKALREHPDLCAEVEMLRAVFHRLEAIGYLREQEHHCSMLSVQVLNRWRERQASSSQQRWKPVLTVLLPALGLAFFALWWHSTQRGKAPSSPEPNLEWVATDQAEPFPYTDGILTFAYWSSGIPPLSQPSPSVLSLEGTEDISEVVIDAIAEPEFGSRHASQAP